jgi:phenylalanyl-tRNA synthetase beta chain
MSWAVVPAAVRDAQREGHEAIRASLVRAGLTETINYTLSPPGGARRGRGPADGPLLGLLNPLSSELTVTRRPLLPGLLQALESNLRHTPSVHVFEHGVVVLPEREGTDPGLPGEQRVSVVMVGDAEPEALWSDNPRLVDLYDVADVVLGVLADLHVESVRLRPAETAPFQPRIRRDLVARRRSTRRWRSGR